MILSFVLFFVKEFSSRLSQSKHHVNDINFTIWTLIIITNDFQWLIKHRFKKMLWWFCLYLSNVEHSICLLCHCIKKEHRLCKLLLVHFWQSNVFPLLAPSLPVFIADLWMWDDLWGNAGYNWVSDCFYLTSALNKT